MFFCLITGLFEKAAQFFLLNRWFLWEFQFFLQLLFLLNRCEGPIADKLFRRSLYFFSRKVRVVKFFTNYVFQSTHYDVHPFIWPTNATIIFTICCTRGRKRRSSYLQLLLSFGSAISSLLYGQCGTYSVINKGGRVNYLRLGVDFETSSFRRINGVASK